jgi:hypothetical protein
MMKNRGGGSIGSLEIGASNVIPMLMSDVWWCLVKNGYLLSLGVQNFPRRLRIP